MTNKIPFEKAFERLEKILQMLNEQNVSLEESKSCWPLPHVIGSPYFRVLSASPTSDKPSSHPRFAGLFGPIRFLAEACRISLVHMESFDDMP